MWKEHTPGQWGQVYQCREHEGSVNSIAWCPVEHGLCLACASSDGRVSVLTRQADDSWTVKRFNAHNIGCNAVSWAPAFPAGAVLSAASPTGAALQPMRLVTGGCDNLVKIWRCAPPPTLPAPAWPPSPDTVALLLAGTLRTETTGSRSLHRGRRTPIGCAAWRWNTGHERATLVAHACDLAKPRY